MSEYEKTFQEEVLERLTRIEEQSLGYRVKGDDHETRIRTVEHRQWMFAGAAVAIGPLLAKLGIHLPSWLN